MDIVATQIVPTIAENIPGKPCKLFTPAVS